MTSVVKGDVLSKRRSNQFAYPNTTATKTDVKSHVGKRATSKIPRDTSRLKAGTSKEKDVGKEKSKDIFKYADTFVGDASLASTTATCNDVANGTKKATSSCNKSASTKSRSDKGVLVNDNVVPPTENDVNTKTDGVDAMIVSDTPLNRSDQENIAFEQSQTSPQYSADDNKPTKQIPTPKSTMSKKTVLRKQTVCAQKSKDKKVLSSKTKLATENSITKNPLSVNKHSSGTNSAIKSKKALTPNCVARSSRSKSNTPSDDCTTRESPIQKVETTKNVSKDKLATPSASKQTKTTSIPKRDSSVICDNTRVLKKEGIARKASVAARPKQNNSSVPVKGKTTLSEKTLTKHNKQFNKSETKQTVTEMPVKSRSNSATSGSVSMNSSFHSNISGTIQEHVIDSNLNDTDITKEQSTTKGKTAIKIKTVSVAETKSSVLRRSRSMSVTSGASSVSSESSHSNKSVRSSGTSKSSSSSKEKAGGVDVTSSKTQNIDTSTKTDEIKGNEPKRKTIPNIANKSYMRTTESMKNRTSVSSISDKNNKVSAIDTKTSSKLISKTDITSNESAKNTNSLKDKTKLKTKSNISNVPKSVASKMKTRDATSTLRKPITTESGVPLHDTARARAPVHTETPLTSKDKLARGVNLMTRKSGNSDIQSPIKRPISKPSSSTRSDIKTNRINSSKLMTTSSSSDDKKSGETHPSRSNLRESESAIKSKSTANKSANVPNSNPINLEKCKNRAAEHKSKLIAPLPRNVSNRVSKVSNQNSRSLSNKSEKITHSKTENVGNTQRNVKSKLQKVKTEKLEIKKQESSPKMETSDVEQNKNEICGVSNTDLCVQNSDKVNDFDGIQTCAVSDEPSSPIGEKQLLTQNNQDSLDSGHLRENGELSLSENIVHLQETSSGNMDQCESGKISEFSCLSEESFLNSGDVLFMKQTEDGLIGMNDKTSVTMETVCAFTRECSEDRANGHSSLVNNDRLSPRASDLHVLNGSESMDGETCTEFREQTTEHVCEYSVKSSDDFMHNVERRLAEIKDDIGVTELDMLDSTPCNDESINANCENRKVCDKSVFNDETVDTCNNECVKTSSEGGASPIAHDRKVSENSEMCVIGVHGHADSECTNNSITSCTDSVDTNGRGEIARTENSNIPCTHLENADVTDDRGDLTDIDPVTSDVCQGKGDNVQAVSSCDLGNNMTKCELETIDVSGAVVCASGDCTVQVLDGTNNNDGIHSHFENDTCDIVEKGNGVNMYLLGNNDACKGRNVSNNKTNEIESKPTRVKSNTITTYQGRNSDNGKSGNSRADGEIDGNRQEHSDLEESFIYTRLNGDDDRTNSYIVMDAGHSVRHQWSLKGCVSQQNDNITDKNEYIKFSSSYTGAPDSGNTDKSQNEAPILRSESILCKDGSPDTAFLDNSERLGNQSFQESFTRDKGTQPASNATDASQERPLFDSLNNYVCLNNVGGDISKGVSVDGSEGNDKSDVIILEKQGSTENSCQARCEKTEVRQTFTSQFLEKSEGSDFILCNKTRKSPEFVREESGSCDSNCVINTSLCKTNSTLCVENDALIREQCEISRVNRPSLEENIDINDETCTDIVESVGTCTIGRGHSLESDLPVLNNGKLITELDDGASIRRGESSGLSSPSVSTQINERNDCQVSEHSEQYSIEKGCALTPMDKDVTRNCEKESSETKTLEHIDSGEINLLKSENGDIVGKCDSCQCEYVNCECNSLDCKCKLLLKSDSSADGDLCNVCAEKSTATPSIIQTAHLDSALRNDIKIIERTSAIDNEAQITPNTSCLCNNSEGNSKHMQTAHCSNCFVEKSEILDPDSEIKLSESKNKCNVVKIAMQRDQTACIPEHHGKIPRTDSNDLISLQYERPQECEAGEQTIESCSLIPGHIADSDQSIDLSRELKMEEGGYSESERNPEDTNYGGPQTEILDAYSNGANLEYSTNIHSQGPDCDGKDTSEFGMSGTNPYLCQNKNFLDYKCSNECMFYEDRGECFLTSSSSSTDPSRGSGDKNLESVQQDVIPEHVEISRPTEQTQCDIITQMKINCNSADQRESPKNSNMDELTFKSPECDHSQGSPELADDYARDQSQSRDTCLMCSTGLDAREVLKSYNPNIHRDFSGDQMSGLSLFEFTSENTGCNQVFSEKPTLDRDIPERVSTNHNSGQARLCSSTELNKSDSCTCTQHSGHSLNLQEFNKGNHELISGCVCNKEEIRPDHCGVLIKGFNFSTEHNNKGNQCGGFDFEGNQSESFEIVKQDSGYHFSKAQTATVHGDGKADFTEFGGPVFPSVTGVSSSQQVLGCDDIDGQIFTTVGQCPGDATETCTECELSTQDSDNRIFEKQPDLRITDKTITGHSGDNFETDLNSDNKPGSDLIAGNVHVVLDDGLLIGDNLVAGALDVIVHNSDAPVGDVVTFEQELFNYQDSDTNSKDYFCKQKDSIFLRRNKFIKSTSLSSLKTNERNIVDEAVHRSAENLHRSFQLSFEANKGKLQLQSSSSQICDNAGEALCDNVSDITDIFDDSGDNFVDAEETIDSEIDTTDIDITNSSSCASDLYKQGDVLTEYDLGDVDSDVTPGVEIDVTDNIESDVTSDLNAYKCRESLTSTESFQDALDNFVDDCCLNSISNSGSKTPENEDNLLQTPLSLSVNSQTNVEASEGVKPYDQLTLNETDDGVIITFADDNMERRRRREITTKSSIVTGSSAIKHVHPAEFRNSPAINDSSYQFYTTSSDLKETQSIVQTTVLRSTDMRNESGHRVIENVIYKAGNSALPVRSNSLVSSGERLEFQNMQGGSEIPCNSDQTLHDHSLSQFQNSIEEIKQEFSNGMITSHKYDNTQSTVACDIISSKPILRRMSSPAVTSVSTEIEVSRCNDDTSIAPSSEQIGKKIETAVTIRTQRRRRRQVLKTTTHTEQSDQIPTNENNTQIDEVSSQRTRNTEDIHSGPKIESINSSKICTGSQHMIFENETESGFPLNVENTTHSTFNESSAASCSIENVPENKEFNSILSSGPKISTFEDQQNGADACDNSVVLIQNKKIVSECENSSASVNGDTRQCDKIGNYGDRDLSEQSTTCLSCHDTEPEVTSVNVKPEEPTFTVSVRTLPSATLIDNNFDDIEFIDADDVPEVVQENTRIQDNADKSESQNASFTLTFEIASDDEAHNIEIVCDNQKDNEYKHECDLNENENDLTITNTFEEGENEHVIGGQSCQIVENKVCNETNQNSELQKESSKVTERNEVCILNDSQTSIQSEDGHDLDATLTGQVTQLEVSVSQISDTYSSDIISPSSYVTDNDGEHDSDDDMDSSVVSEESNISVALALKLERQKLNKYNNNCTSPDDCGRSRSRIPHGRRNIRSASTGNFLLQLQNTNIESEDTAMLSTIKAGLSRKSIKKSSSFRIDRERVYSPVDDGSPDNMETVKSASKKVSDICRSFVQKARSTSRPRADEEDTQVKSPTPQRKLMKWVNDNGKWLRIPVNEVLVNSKSKSPDGGQRSVSSDRQEIDTSTERELTVFQNDKMIIDEKTTKTSDITVIEDNVITTNDNIVMEGPATKASDKIVVEKRGPVASKNTNVDRLPVDNEDIELVKGSGEPNVYKVSTSESLKTSDENRVGLDELENTDTNIKPTQLQTNERTGPSSVDKIAPIPKKKPSFCLSQKQEEQNRTNESAGGSDVSKIGISTQLDEPMKQDCINEDSVKLEVGPSVMYSPTKPKPKLHLDIRKATEQCTASLNDIERPNTAPIHLHPENAEKIDAPIMNRNDFLLGIKDNVSRRKLVKMLSPTRSPQKPDFDKASPNKDERSEEQITSPKRIPKLTAVKIQEEIFEGKPEYTKQCNIDPLGITKDHKEPETMSTIASHRKSRQFKDIKKSKTFTSIEDVKGEQPESFIVLDSYENSMVQTTKHDTVDIDPNTTVKSGIIPTETELSASEMLERKTSCKADKRKIKAPIVPRDRSLQRSTLLSEIVEVEENKDELQQPASNNKSKQHGEQQQQQQQSSNNKKERKLKKSGTIGNKRRSLSLPTGSLAFGDARIVYKNGHFTIESMDGYEIDSSRPPDSDEDEYDPNSVNTMHVTADSASRRLDGVVMKSDSRETTLRPGLKRQCAKTALTRRDSDDSVFYTEQDDVSEFDEQADKSCSTSSQLSETSLDSRVSVDFETENSGHDRQKSQQSSSSLPETGSSPTIKHEALRARRTSSFRRAQAAGALSLAGVKEEQIQEADKQTAPSSLEENQNSPSSQKSTPKRKTINDNMNLFSKQSESAKDFFSKRMNLKGLFRKNKSDLGLVSGSPLKTQHPVSPPIAAFQGDDDIGSIDTPPGSPGPKLDFRRRHTSADIYIKSFADASASDLSSNSSTPTQERHNAIKPTVSTPTTPNRESNSSLVNLTSNGSVCSVEDDRISVTSASSAASSSHSSVQSPGMEQPHKPKTPKPVGASPRRSHSIGSQSSRTSYQIALRDRSSTSVTSLESDNCDNLPENVISGHCDCERRLSRPRLRSDSKVSIDSNYLCQFCRQCLEYGNSAGVISGANVDKQRKNMQNSSDDSFSAKTRKDSNNRTSYEKLAIISQTAVVSSNSNDSGIQRDVGTHSSNESIKGSQDGTVKLRRKKSLSPHSERPKSEAGVRWADLDLDHSEFSHPVRLRNRAHNFKDRPRPKSDLDDSIQLFDELFEEILEDFETEGSSFLSERMKAFGSEINLQPYCSLRNLYEMKKRDFDKQKNRRMSTPHPIKSRLQRSPKKLQKQPPLVRSSSMPESLDKITKRRKLHLLDFHMDSLQRHLDAEECFSDDSDLSFDHASLQERSLSVQSSQSQLTSMDEDEDNLIYAEALWDHITMVPDEIGFRAQDVIEVMDMRDKDWWYGAIEDNEGWFPAAFVRLRVNQDQVEEEDLEMTLQENLTSSPKSRRISMLNKNQARTNVVNEIINAEREYVKHLKDVVEGYIQHARKRSEMFPEERIALIFGNIETIYAFARKFLGNLEKCIDVCPHLSEIGQCFLDNEKGFEVYSDYCNNHPSACEELKELCMDSKYRHFFEACRLLQELVEIPLEGFLLTPVQKICKYPLQLAELLKYTPPDHADYITVKDALSSMRKIATLINERKRKMESIEKIAAWQHTVADWDGEDLLERSSELIFSGDINKVNTAGWSQERYFFLFDHQLIYCKKELLKRHVFSYKGRIDLDNCEVVDVPDGRDTQYNVTVKHGWKLHETQKDKWYLLYGKTQAIKQKWLKALADERKRVQEDKENDFCVPDHWKQTVLNKVRSHSNFKDKQPASRINPNHQVPYQKDLKDFPYSTLPRRRLNSQKQDKKKGWFIFGGKKSKR